MVRGLVVLGESCDAVSAWCLVHRLLEAGVEVHVYPGGLGLEGLDPGDPRAPYHVVVYSDCDRPWVDCRIHEGARVLGAIGGGVGALEECGIRVPRVLGAPVGVDKESRVVVGRGRGSLYLFNRELLRLMRWEGLLRDTPAGVPEGLEGLGRRP